MTLLPAVLAMSLAVLAPQKDDKDAIVGMWKLDQRYGMALEAAKYSKPLDWIITFSKDGKYVWRSYDPFVEGVGRRYRETKGTYIVNLPDSRLVLKTKEITGQMMSIVCIISEDGKSFVIPQGEKHYNVYQDRRMKFLKVEVKKPVEDTTGGGATTATTGGGGSTTGGGQL